MRRLEDGLRSDNDCSAVTSDYSVLGLVEEFVSWSAEKAFNQFEKFNEISNCAVPEWTTDQADGAYRRMASFEVTIRLKSLTWSRKLSIKLNLAHVARN